MSIARDTSRRAGAPAAAGWRSYGLAALLVAVTIGAAVVFRRLPHANLPLLFMVVVLVIAARWGLWPSIFASLLSFFALNFFFTQPYYTLAVEEEGDIATLVFFLAMAALTGNLAARMRSETENSRAALERVAALLDFSRRMAGASGAREAFETLASRLSATCRARVVALQPDAGGMPIPVAEAPDPVRRSESADSADLPAGLLESAPQAGGWKVFELDSGGRTVGWVALAVSELEPGRRALAEALCDQASVAVGRAALVDRLRAAQIESETERLRSALLSSVSHDLKTPLVSIIGATTSLIEYRDALRDSDRSELLETVLGEAERLNRYIQNLLDMTRFGQQPFELRREWVDLNDLVSCAVERLGAKLASVRLELRIEPDVSLLHVHGALIEQVLVNLLDNAADFAPPDSEIGIDARRLNDAVVIDVTDAGPGVPEAERDRVFDMFYRAEQRDRRERAGTGLGLAICRSIVAAHAGAIEALPRPDATGALFRVTLPLSENAAETVDHEREDPDHRGRRADPEVSAHQS